MDIAEEFRTRAQHCLKLAHEALTLEAQTHWLAMAQLWFSLAEHAEERDAASIGEASAWPQVGRKHGNGHADGNDSGEGR